MKLMKNILKAMLARCISCHIFVFNIKTFLFTFQLNICHFMPTSLGGVEITSGSKSLFSSIFPLSQFSE